jgi:hypothetical protein
MALFALVQKLVRPFHYLAYMVLVPCCVQGHGAYRTYDRQPNEAYAGAPSYGPRDGHYKPYSAYQGYHGVGC